MQDASGNIRKWFVTCTDIHDLKMAELTYDGKSPGRGILTLAAVVTFMAQGIRPATWWGAKKATNIAIGLWGILLVVLVGLILLLRKG
jgi:hypothetical protein